MIAHRIAAGLRPDPARVIAQLFLPGEELPGTRSRASQVVGRVMSLAEDEVERLAAALLHDFGGRHHHYQALLRRHAATVAPSGPEAGKGKRSLIDMHSLLMLNKEIVQEHPEAWAEHDITARGRGIAEDWPGPAG